MDLEQRIAAALADTTIAADTIADLHDEALDALAAAEQTVADERQRSLDLTDSRDPKEAIAAIYAAELTVDRLQSALTRLEQRHRQVVAQEAYAVWLPK